MPSKTPTILEFKNVSKAYHGNKVLKDISFTVKAGEIHGLIGENGAGKSTLMNLLFGMPVIHETGGYDGDVLFHGKKVNFTSPADAMRHGIGMVHQEFMLIPGMTVFENIKLNHEPTSKMWLNKFLPGKLKFLDFAKMRADSKKALTKVGMAIDETQVIEGLPVGHKQFIEIAREVDSQHVQLLVFDEPTAVLAESEADTLLKTMRHLAKDLNIAILFISHRLQEVEDICDKVTIIRDGEHIGNFSQGNIDKEKMAELMVGRKVGLEIPKSAHRSTSSESHLELKNFSVQMPGERVKSIDLKIQKGEILGIGGLAGQGKLGISNGVAGLYPTSGEVVFEGKKIKLNNPLASLKLGMGFLTEDRRHVGLLLDDSIANNIVFTSLNVKNDFLRGLFVDEPLVQKHARDMIKLLDIRCQGPHQATRRLSGGNQQKVCLSRVMTLDPKILFVSEPTRGVDIGAKRLILETLVKLNEEKGITIVITSSELLELKAVADRIAIVSEGKISNILSPNAPDKEFGLAMAA